jgi:hypothetical protein
MRIKFSFISVTCLFLLFTLHSIASVNVKLMCWNLLNYPDASNASGDTTLRNPFYRTVIGYENPDILVTEENTFSSATTWFLNSVMNASSVTYSKGTFVNGPDTDNEIYFKTGAFTFVSNIPIVTDVRDISEFKLVHIASGDTIRIYAVHLKASSGSPNDQQRADEVDSLRKVTNALPAGSNFIVCGDFNIYGDYELAYQKLKQNNTNDDGNFIDPIYMTGTWHNYSYRSYHTQSTRTTSFGGGATGGLNDRFDMILYSTAISLNASGISYVTGSTTPVGNDGNHYDDDINLMPNTAGPSNVINALYNASDHLPVFAVFSFSGTSGINNLDYIPFAFSVVQNLSKDEITVLFTLDHNQNVKLEMTDLLGRQMFALNVRGTYGTNQIPVSAKMNDGIYFINLLINDQRFTKKILIDRN